MAPPTVPRFFPPCKASCDYASGLKEGDNIETVCGELRNMFEYFRAMRTTKSHLRYFDYRTSGASLTRGARLVASKEIRSR